MSKFINDSKEIIDIINIYFDPTEEQKAKNQKNGNFSSLENNPFSIDVDESRYMNDFSRLFQDNENREPNDSMNKESITETEKNKKIFILDFSKAIKILITNFNNLTNSNKLMKYPTLENENDIQSLLNFFKLIFQPDSYNKSFQNISDSTEVTTQQLIENLNSLLGISEEKSENSDEFDDLLDEAFVNEVSSNKFDEIKKKIFFFINIISKENQKFTKKDLKSFSDKISKSLDINFADLFLIQNAPINNFAKCFNFKEISLKQNPNFPPVSKLLELQSIKYKLLIKDFNIKEENFDNTGNLLVPNTRQNRFRGKEIYDPPYNWLGLGLSVLGKFDDGNDDWLEDISEKSEWAIAYRGISSKNQERMLKYFIVIALYEGINVEEFLDSLEENDIRTIIDEDTFNNVYVSAVKEAFAITEQKTEWSITSRVLNVLKKNPLEKKDKKVLKEVLVNKFSEEQFDIVKSYFDIEIKPKEIIQ